MPKRKWNKLKGYVCPLCFLETVYRTNYDMGHRKFCINCNEYVDVKENN